MWKIWDRKFGYYCLVCLTKEQADVMVQHFVEMDKITGEYLKNRYRVDWYEKGQ